MRGDFSHHLCLHGHGSGLPGGKRAGTADPGPPGHLRRMRHVLGGSQGVPKYAGRAGDPAEADDRRHLCDLIVRGEGMAGNCEECVHYDYDDEVEVGDTRPTLEGVFGNVLYYKGFSCSVQLRYSFGADAFNYTLYSKVENISKTALQNNQDRRALYNRWKKPGDMAKFKGISLTESTPISSRFVMKNHYMSLESIRIGYEIPERWLKKIRISGMSLSGYMNQICRISSIKDERGIDYPFARSVSFSLSVNL